jgi:hypothetical protein
MYRSILGGLLVCALFLTPAAQAQNQLTIGAKMPDFPPGTFTDGSSLKLPDLRGKLVVLYFFEPG